MDVVIPIDVIISLLLQKIVPGTSESEIFEIVRKLTGELPRNILLIFRENGRLIIEKLRQLDPRIPSYNIGSAGHRVICYWGLQKEYTLPENCLAASETMTPERMRVSSENARRWGWGYYRFPETRSHSEIPNFWEPFEGDTSEIDEAYQRESERIKLFSDARIAKEAISHQLNLLKIFPTINGHADLKHLGIIHAFEEKIDIKLFGFSVIRDIYRQRIQAQLRGPFQPECFDEMLYRTRLFFHCTFLMSLKLDAECDGNNIYVRKNELYEKIDLKTFGPDFLMNMELPTTREELLRGQIFALFVDCEELYPRILWKKRLERKYGRLWRDFWTTKSMNPNRNGILFQRWKKEMMELGYVK